MSLLEQLDNNEAILLMYLAGELPESDHAEVQQMLSRDAALRDQLAQLAALQDSVTSTLALADTAPLHARRDAAARQFTRDFAAFEPVTVSAAPQPAHRRNRIGWLLYPVAAAAMLLLAFSLIHNRGNGTNPIAVGPITPPTTEAVTDNVASARPVPQSNVQIFPDELERELISLRTDDSGFFDEK